eukprot:327750-Rhodomonas_salina.2
MSSVGPARTTGKQSVAFSPDSDTDRQMLASGGNDCDTRQGKLVNKNNDSEIKVWGAKTCSALTGLCC